MKFIIEVEGPVFDIGPAWHKAHEDAATQVGWSRMDQARFWALVRSKGRDGDILPGARPIKVKEYQSRFDERIEAGDIIGLYAPHAGIVETLSVLSRFGACVFFCGGPNVKSRQYLLKTHELERFGSEVFPLDLDPRRRPGELRALAANDPRTVVATSTEGIIRAADAAELFTVGVLGGACSAPRLHRAGARVVYSTLGQLAESLRGGGRDLVQAGLLPAPLG